MPGLVICYFVGSIILLLPAMNMCAKACCCDFCCVSFLHSAYLIGKLVLLIIMLVFAQLDYNKNWEENTCPELKDLTLFWLIFNYIMLAATFVYYIIFGGIHIYIYINFNTFNNYIFKKLFFIFNLQ